MKFGQVTVLLLALVGHAIATGYGSGSGGYGGGSTGPKATNYGGGQSGQSGPPKPYNFDYNAADEEGNSHYRSEQGDESGNVKGTYGYNDIQGIYRIVEYVADANGFRASIRTNEPGVDGKESPADVSLTAEQPPAGLGSSAGSYKPAASAPRSFGGLSSGVAPKAGSGKSGY